MIEQVRKCKYLDSEYKEKTLKEMQELLDLIIEEIYSKYLIYNPFNYKQTEKYWELQAIRMEALQKEYYNEDKEKEKLDKQEKAIESKKEEIKELHKQKQTTE